MLNTISNLRDEYIATLRHKGRTAAMIKAYDGDLCAAAEAFSGDIRAIPRAALEAWLCEATAASTQARKLASLRAFHIEWAGVVSEREREDSGRLQNLAREDVFSCELCYNDARKCP